MCGEGYSYEVSRRPHPKRRSPSVIHNWGPLHKRMRVDLAQNCAVHIIPLHCNHLTKHRNCIWQNVEIMAKNVY